MHGREWLTCGDFTDLVGQDFAVSAQDEQPLVMELVAAEESDEPGGRGPAGQERMQFSLVFRAPAAPVLPQGTYRLVHAATSELELFLVPLGPDAEGMRYEAAFA